MPVTSYRDVVAATIADYQLRDSVQFMHRKMQK